LIRRNADKGELRSPWLVVGGWLLRDAQDFGGDLLENAAEIRSCGRVKVLSGGLGGVVDGTSGIVRHAFHEGRIDRFRGSPPKADGVDDGYQVGVVPDGGGLVVGGIYGRGDHGSRHIDADLARIGPDRKSVV